MLQHNNPGSDNASQNNSDNQNLAATTTTRLGPTANYRSTSTAHNVHPSYSAASPRQHRSITHYHSATDTN